MIEPPFFRALCAFYSGFQASCDELQRQHRTLHSPEANAARFLLLLHGFLHLEEHQHQAYAQNDMPQARHT